MDGPTQRYSAAGEVSMLDAVSDRSQAFWFPEIAQFEQPVKTSRTMPVTTQKETRELMFIFRKPYIFCRFALSRLPVCRPVPETIWTLYWPVGKFGNVSCAAVWSGSSSKAAVPPKGS